MSAPEKNLSSNMSCYDIPTLHFYSEFVRSRIFIAFQNKRSYFLKSINQVVFEITDSVYCAVGTESANNILTSFLLPKVKQKLVCRVDFIIARPCIIYISFHSKHFKDNTCIILIGLDVIKLANCYVHPVKISVLWNVDNITNSQNMLQGAQKFSPLLSEATVL